MESFINKYQLSWPDISKSEVLEILKYITNNHFKQTTQIINQAYECSDGCLRNVLFSILQPETDIKMHVNYNPHMYRAYLGLDIPEGDIAMKICGDVYKWHNGKILLLDHSFPHCPHNRTEQPRVALVIDFLKPDKDRKEMLSLEKNLIAKRMKDNPLGLGIFTTEDKVSDEVFKKYDLEYQLNWQGENMV
ncbi:aspartyl/asparaginyl beta-hydroxylase domain-containing protein [Cysteiniphilum sp. 6C5]|uniref:aspartyl/asparaginyl beta-hydroxylase domain-containing protein n=1 Tax=unclassified Cysteiniphilum TaxID=2610889 RepID=UPI003F870055